MRSRSLPAQTSLRPKPNFPSPFNPITSVQISRQKYSALRFPQITRTLSRIPPHEEGRFAIVTNVEAGCGGRDGSQASHADERADPPSRESRRDRYQARCTGSRARLSRTAKPCGPGAPTLALSSQRRPRVSRATGAKEPGPRGERGVRRQTIAQGRPGVPAEPVVPAPRILNPHGGRGYQSIPGLPCALDLWRV